MAPTLVEGVATESEISCTELFGPITTLHRVARLRGGGRRLANDSPYGLTAAIWTREHPPRPGVRAPRRRRRRRVGQRPDVRLEPHMPFGGVRRVGQRLARGRAPRRSTSTPTGRPSTSTTTRPVSDAVAVALDPRPGGSKRVPGKNIRPLARPPAARVHDRGGARGRCVRPRSSSRPTSEEIAEIAAPLRRRGAVLRPAEMARSTSPDIEWLLPRARTARGDGRCSRSCARRARSAARPTDPPRVGALPRAAATAPTRSAPSSRVRQHPGRCGWSRAT